MPGTYQEQADARHPILAKLRDFKIRMPPNRNLLPRAVAAGKGSIAGLNQLGRDLVNEDFGQTQSGRRISELTQPTIESMKQWGREAIRGPDTQNIPLQLPPVGQTMRSSNPNFNPAQYGPESEQAIAETVARMQNWRR